MPLSTTDDIITVAGTSKVVTTMGWALADDGGTTTDMANLILFDNWG